MLFSIVFPSISWAHTLYSTPTCPQCVVAKQALTKNCIKYRVINITRDNPYGITGVPVLDTDDGQRLDGAYEIKRWASKNNRCNS
jgi:glutaredoxin